MRWSVLAVSCVLLAGCHGHAAHPVLQTLRTPPPGGVPAEEAPEPGFPTGADARRQLYRGLEDVESPLSLLAERGSPLGTVPPLIELPLVEQAFFRRTRGRGPFGAVHHAAAFGMSGVLPLPPAEVADVLLSDGVERWALDADVFEGERWEYRLPTQTRRRYRVEMLGRGFGPIRVDLRYVGVLERWDLDDGTVLLRYGSTSNPPPDGVTLYRGAAILAPVEGGTRLTEMLLVGTDVRVPFFLAGTLRGLALDMFRIRITRLWQYAHDRARR